MVNTSKANPNRSKEENNFTSTGIKFWKHKESMAAYKERTGNSIISTHISPESSCNLNCPYCSVAKREKKYRLSMDTIQEYIENLITRGLRAVIITGGGEPTLYPQINELICWLKYTKCLSVALITNGTKMECMADDALKALSWIRVSINTFEDWETSINIPYDKLSPDGVAGCSYICDENQLQHDTVDKNISLFRKIAKVANQCGASYVRVLPNCLLDGKAFEHSHQIIDRILEKLGDKRFFHQNKWHKRPTAFVCHQSYFRPYLSEIPWDDGVPGTVFPCDSIVLNEYSKQFLKKYRLCKPSEILDFLDQKIAFPFNATEECRRCVFTDTVNMLDSWLSGNIDFHEEMQNIKLLHEDFV